MSHVDDIIRRGAAAAFTIGVAALAERANVKEDALRRLLKTPPKAIKNLRALEAYLDDEATRPLAPQSPAGE